MQINNTEKQYTCVYEYNSLIVNTLNETIVKHVYSDQFRFMLINRMVIQRVFVSCYKFIHPLKSSDNDVLPYMYRVFLVILMYVVLRFIIEN